MPEPTQILGLVEGDPRTSVSHVAHFLFEALDERFPVVDRIDYGPQGVGRVALAAATFRFSRAEWRARYHTGRLARRAQSLTLARRVSAVDQDFDLALQIFGWVRGQPKPYALYVDQTRLMAERGWPDWMPLARRERSELLELERTMYAQAFHVFVMGGSARDSLLADYGMPPSRVTVVGGGLNLDFIPPPAGPSRDPAILFVGRDFQRKGGDCLLQAFRSVRREVPHATLHVVGVTARFDEPGVVTHGKVFSREQLSELYRRSRMLCLPSRYEPWGLVLVEAMAHGVPCIGTTVQAIPDILDGGRAGVLVAPDDPDQLAAAIVDLLKDEERARKIGAAGRSWMESELTWDRVVDRMSPALLRVRDPSSAGP